MNMVYHGVVVWVWQGYYYNVLKKAKGDLYIWLLVLEPAFRFESPEGKFKKNVVKILSSLFGGAFMKIREGFCKCSFFVSIEIYF